MTFQLSPNVSVREIDLTNVIPAVSTTVGGFVGDFTWGPVDKVTLVNSEKTLVNQFGRPTVDKTVDFLTAASFLAYSNALRVTRVIDETASNATTSGQKVVIKNEDEFDGLAASFAGTLTVETSTENGSGATTIPLDDATGVQIGDEVSGTSIVPGTLVTAVNNNDITIDNATLAVIDGTVTPIEITITFNRGTFAARYPSVYGNSLKVEICGDATSYDTWAYKNVFTSAPGTSDYAATRGATGDELHIVVIDENGNFSGTPGTILESYAFVSQAQDAKDSQGTSIYYVDQINRTSRYIWSINAPDGLTESGSLAQGVAFTQLTSVLATPLSGGANSGDVTLGAYELGYDLFVDSETVDISLLIQAAATDHKLSNKLIAIADERKDCVAFTSPPILSTAGSTTPLDDVLTWSNLVTSSSYGFMDSTAIKVYDKYNDKFVWIPGAGLTAGLCAETDSVADPWFSPAGFNRGQYRNVVSIAFNPNKAQRDDLYAARVNPIVSFAGEGTVLYGDKTALAKPSAFDRINVRRLFIVLEKAIATASRFQLFEFNDDYTRTTFLNAVEPFLRNVQARRGLNNFTVVCDETNNDGAVIDANGFVGDIYIQPTRSINYISLNFVATRTGVEFNEIAGSN